MRLYLISDIHFEHNPSWTFPKEVPDFDVAVIAGDVAASVSLALLALGAAPILRGKPVVYVPGNHEFYGTVLQDNLEQGLADAAERYPDIHVLHRRSVVIQGVRFAGATLWTDYKLHSTTKPSMVVAGRTLDDHRLIRYREASGHIARFMPWHTRSEHFADRKFLSEALSLPHDGPSVVVTHHLPSPKSVAPRFQGNELSPSFASDLGALILEYQPTLWVHGHTHDTCDYKIGSTRILCNPKGYGPHPKQFGAEYDRFDPAMIVEVDS